MKIKIRPTYQAEKVDKIKIPYQQIASKPYTSLISTHKCMNLIFVEHQCFLQSYVYKSVKNGPKTERTRPRLSPFYYSFESPIHAQTSDIYCPAVNQDHRGLQTVFLVKDLNNWYDLLLTPILPQALPPPIERVLYCLYSKQLIIPHIGTYQLYLR